MTTRRRAPARTACLLAVSAAGVLLAGGIADAAAPAAPVRVVAPAAPAAAKPGPAAGDTQTGTTTAATSQGQTSTAAKTGAAAGGDAADTAAQQPDGNSITVDLGNQKGKPSESLVVLLGLAVISIAPALLVLVTSFTKIVVVLSLTRNALGLQNVPPNQVLAGLALFLSLFLMGPVLSQVNKDGLQPYLHGTKPEQQAYDDGTAPLKTWMLKQTRRDDIAMLTSAAKQPKPASPQATPMGTLVPAFVLSELRGAFIIGLAIFVPFLVIDLVVSSSLMSLGMMMVPPVLVSLPFKILMFVLIDGWALIIHALLASYH